MKRQNIAIIISILALCLSLIGLFLSYKNQEYDRLVAYEQKKQEIRLLLVETDLLFKKLEKAYFEIARTNTTPEIKETATTLYSGAKHDHQLMASGGTIFDTLPTSTGTEARLKLEIIFANQQKNQQNDTEFAKGNGQV